MSCCGTKSNLPWARASGCGVAKTDDLLEVGEWADGCLGNSREMRASTEDAEEIFELAPSFFQVRTDIDKH